MNDDKKCGLECIRTNAARMCVKPEKGQCPRCKQLMEEAQEHYRQLEASYSQVSKALCNKENATLDEILEAITQVKAERDDARMNHAHVARLLEKTVEMKERFKRLVVKAMKELGTVKRERDAAVRDCARFPCYTCAERENGDFCPQCRTTGTFRALHEWRGVCPENTEVQE